MAKRSWGTATTTPSEKRARTAAYDAKRREQAIAEHRCRRCFKVMPVEYSWTYCSPCRAADSARRNPSGRRRGGQPKYA